MMTLRMFYYNWLGRHLIDWRARREWLAEGRDPADFPRSGKVDLETFEWAREQFKNGF